MGQGKGGGVCCNVIWGFGTVKEGPASHIHYKPCIIILLKEGDPDSDTLSAVSVLVRK